MIMKRFASVGRCDRRFEQGPGIPRNACQLLPFMYLRRLPICSRSTCIVAAFASAAATTY